MMTDRECIIEMHTDIKHILKNQDKIWLNLDDQCKKINDIEKWDSKVIGIALAISIIIPIVITILL